jgi:hypothetical protein
MTPIHPVVTAVPEIDATACRCGLCSRIPSSGREITGPKSSGAVSHGGPGRPTSRRRGGPHVPAITSPPRGLDRALGTRCGHNCVGALPPFLGTAQPGTELPRIQPDFPGPTRAMVSNSNTGGRPMRAWRMVAAVKTFPLTDSAAPVTRRAPNPPSHRPCCSEDLWGGLFGKSTT